MNDLIDKMVMNDEPLGLVYMWVKQNHISKKQFNDLITHYFTHLSNDIDDHYFNRTRG